MGILDLLSGKSRGSQPHSAHDDRCLCEPHQAAGIVSLTEGEFAGALASFDEAINVCPNNYKAWGNRGICLRELGRHEEGMKSLEKAIHLKPDYGIAWENKGILLVKQGREDDALECFRTSWERDPTRAMPHIRAARIYIDRKLFHEAIACCDAALRVEPRNGAALSKKAMALHERGDRTAAQEAYEAAVRADPNDPETLNNFGTLLEETGNVKGGATFYRAAMKAQPDYAAARLNLQRLESATTSKNEGTSRAPEAATLSVRQLFDSLEEALVAVARQREYVPPDHVVQPAELHERGGALGVALVKRFMQGTTEEGAGSEGFIKLFDFALMTGMNDVYELLRGSGEVSADVNVKDVFRSEAPTPAMPEQITRLMRMMPMPTLLNNELSAWGAKYENAMEKAGLALPEIIVYALITTYTIGANRALRLLRQW